MTVASNIPEAISLAASNVNAKGGAFGSTLRTDLNNYANGSGTTLKTILDEQVIAERTVADWRVLLTEQVANTAPDGSSTSQSVKDVIADVLQRQLRATENAENAGRITTLQETLILEAYNANFG